MLFLTEREVKQLLPMSVAIDLVRESFRALGDGSAINQPRRRLNLPSGAQLHSLAGAFGNYFGSKIYATHPRPLGGAPVATFYYLLFRAADSAPLAILEANELGRIRTGAASGVVTDCLASPDATVVGVIGTGYQARTQLHAICSVRAVTEVRVFARRAESRKRFVEEFREFEAGLVRAVDSAWEAAHGAHIIVTATRSAEPILPDAAVMDGTHINAIGSNVADRSELEPATVRRSQCIAVDSWEQAELEAGDLLCAYQGEPWPSDQICEVTELLRDEDRRPGRLSAADITIFKSTGLGVQDTAVAGWVFERAVAAGVGERLPRTL
ncbi:MAG: ornithine cyclodeaminase family protein [Bryobacterales bacterium]|nr:ornithine cyclodeaminase family protein [Bryobacterales bacterium]